MAPNRGTEGGTHPSSRSHTRHGYILCGNWFKGGVSGWRGFVVAFDPFRSGEGVPHRAAARAVPTALAGEAGRGTRDGAGGKQELDRGM